MKKILTSFVAAGLLAGIGCNAGPDTDSDTPERPTGPGAAAPGRRPQPEPPGPGAGPRGQAWDQMIQRLQQQQAVSEQERAAQADEHYRLADRYYQTQDLERSEAECEKALQLNPNHASAKALWLEVQFIQGRGQATPASKEYEKVINEVTVQHQQTILEIDNHLQDGVRAYNGGFYDEAERHFRTILEYAKWLPTGPDLESRRQKSAELLEQTKTAKRQKDIDEQRLRLEMIEEERARDEVKKKIEEKRELEILFGQAQLAFERENYTKCIELCDKILYRNPTLTSVEEMRTVSQRLRHVKSERDNLKSYVEEWKRTFEQIELAGILAAEDLSFPARELWQEVICKRQPRGIQKFDEDELSPEDQQIADKLKNVKFEVDFTNATLTYVVDYVRETSGLNFNIQGVENPDQILITFKAKEIPLDSALRLMLSQNKLAYIVEDGVVIVTSQDALKRKVVVEFYDVQDLTYGLTDFPGVDITLGADGSINTTAGVGGEEPGKVFTGESLRDLIRDTIDKGGWDADGKAIDFNNGILIVRNTVAAHRLIQKFLSDLRASSGILVSIEARFLTVEDDFLQQVGMDFRDVDGSRVGSLGQLNDINPVFATQPGAQFATFTDPDGTGPLSAISAGLTFTKVNPHSAGNPQTFTQNMGARVQNIMVNDLLQRNFFQQVMSPIGGMSLQYTLLDSISLEAILRLVSRDKRSHVLTAPKITVFNTQRGNIRISNQFSYIQDYNIQLAVGAIAPDPVPGIVSDGISLDVRPIVSADRRYVTLEMRPTVAQLVPGPPLVGNIVVNLTGPANAALATPGNVSIEVPVLSVQRLKTTVVVPDRGTLLIGGLTTLFDLSAESSIPGLRNLPLLGILGSNRMKGLQRKQLLTLVRARIIIPDEEEHRRFD